MRTYTLIACLLLMSFCLAGCAGRHGSPLSATIADYMQALRRSSDPADQAMLKEIEDGPADLAREKAAATADGIPLAADGVAPPPAADNAEPLYEDWSKKLDKNRDWAKIAPYADSLSVGYAYTPAQLSRVQAFIDANKDLFSEMHRATRKPFVYEPWRPDEPDFREMAWMREAARELSTESYLLASQKKYSQAVDTQSLGLREAHQLDYQPSLIAYLVGIAVEAISLSGYRDIMYIAGPNAAVGTEMDRTIRSHVPELSLKRAFVGELAHELDNFDMLRTAPKDIGDVFVDDDTKEEGSQFSITQTEYTPAEIVFLTNMVDASEARYIAYFRSLVAAADEPQWRRAAVFNRPATIPPSKSVQVRHFDYYQRLANVFLAVLQQWAVKDVDMRATERETEAMAELLAIRARTGRFPDALPGGFMDPFNGKPLGYRREGSDGFVVYSVGPSGDFDGGKPGVKPKTWQAYVRYPAPKPVPVPADLLK